MTMESHSFDASTLIRLPWALYRPNAIWQGILSTSIPRLRHAFLRGSELAAGVQQVRVALAGDSRVQILDVFLKEFFKQLGDALVKTALRLFFQALDIQGQPTAKMFFNEGPLRFQ